MAEHRSPRGGEGGRWGPLYPSCFGTRVRVTAMPKGTRSFRKLRKLRRKGVNTKPHVAHARHAPGHHGGWRVSPAGTRARCSSRFSRFVCDLHRFAHPWVTPPATTSNWPLRSSTTSPHSPGARGSSNHGGCRGSGLVSVRSQGRGGEWQTSLQTGTWRLAGGRAQF